MDRLKVSIIPVALVMAALLGPRAVWAATPSVSFVVPSAVIRADDAIPVAVTIDSAGQLMNAVELTGTFSTKNLRVDHIQTGQQAFPLWPETPRWDNLAGTFHLVAGRPGGLVAINATVATIYFRAQQPGVSTIDIQAAPSNIFLNDGRGTRVQLAGHTATLNPRDVITPSIVVQSTSHPSPDTWYRATTVQLTWAVEDGAQYSYVFSTDASVTPDDTPESTVGAVTYQNQPDGQYVFSIKKRTGVHSPWSEATQRRVLIDSTPPAAFTLVHPNPDSVEHHQLLAWSASDVTSGIKQTTVSVRGQNLGPVTSPLTLQPAWRGALLTVTAMDQAGNTTVATWQYGSSVARWPWMALAAAVVIIAVFAGWVVWLRRRS